MRCTAWAHSRATVHGFRAMASTALNEMGFRPDVIERQLAHQERNAVRAAYNRAEYLSERRAMMNDWANHLDAMAGGNVVSVLAKGDQSVGSRGPADGVVLVDEETGGSNLRQMRAISR